jgi:hydroxymethylpyrimidine pyrophosphatase-like HAD family hydrolase
MRFEALASDYDGTLASDGRVAPGTLAALRRFRESGRRLLLVTGRELEDLWQTFPQWALVDSIVAENGGVLYSPAERQMQLLHEPLPARFVQELRRRGIRPLSVGHVLAATREPNEALVLEVIRQLGLELKIIFNKGAVMVLPPGVNKATGLARTLEQAQLTPEVCVGVGDAENDHAFLDFCGCGVAVADALDSLKQEADYVTTFPNGSGIVELIDRILADRLELLSRGRKPSFA